MWKTGLALVATLLATQQPSLAEIQMTPEAIRIKITIGTSIIRAHLNDSPTARDFAAMLPLTLKLKDYAQTEKISDLPAKLTSTGAPAGYKPVTGDITYYAPWGNLAIFHRDFSHATGLILLGKIDSGLESIRQQGNLTGTIEKDDGDGTNR